MKRLLIGFALFAGLLFFVTSCGPLTYTISVDKRVGMDTAIDFDGKLPGILMLTDSRSAADSALFMHLTNGMASKLESELGLQHGVVPVYSMPADSVNMDVSRMYLHDYTGVDYLVVVDSLSVGSYSVQHPQERAYYNGQAQVQTIVALPLAFGMEVFSVEKDSPIYSVDFNDSYQWSLFSEKPMADVTASQKVDSEIGASFEKIGASMVENIMPGWETVNRMIYYYDSEKWIQACEYAYLFEWQKAMDIWLTEADSQNTQKAYCAAHNISVACEVLEMKELAQQWKDRARKLSQKIY